MKLIKRLLGISLFLSGIILVSVLMILAADWLDTRYLVIRKSLPASSATYLITNVHVIPMDRDTVLWNKVVYVRDGIIRDISDRIDVSGVEVFDGRHRFLAPGLIDMHVHLWDRHELGLYLSNGVTAIRNVWGMPMHQCRQHPFCDE